jgi:hypothetical protein
LRDKIHVGLRIVADGRCAKRIRRALS